MVDGKFLFVLVIKWALYTWRDYRLCLLWNWIGLLKMLIRRVLIWRLHMAWVILLLHLLSFLSLSLFLLLYIAPVFPKCCHPHSCFLFLCIHPICLLAFIEFETLNSPCHFELGIISLLISLWYSLCWWLDCWY